MASLIPLVIPAQAGIQGDRVRFSRGGANVERVAIIVHCGYWIPACAGMTSDGDEKTRGGD